MDKKNNLVKSLGNTNSPKPNTLSKRQQQPARKEQFQSLDLLNHTSSEVSLLDTRYVSPFIVDGVDLSTDSTLNIEDTLKKLNTKLGNPGIGYNNLLSTLYYFAINSHLIKVFLEKDINRFIKKSYSIIIMYLLCYTISNITLKLVPKSTHDILINYRKLIGLFNASSDSTSFYEVLKTKEYSEPTRILVASINESFSFLQGNLFGSLAKLQHLIDPLLSMEITNVLSFTKFKELSFASINPTVKIVDGTSQLFLTDLDILSFLSLIKFSNNFLMEDKVQKKTILHLKSNFELLFKYYYYYVLFQDPSSLLNSLGAILGDKKSSKFIKQNSSFVVSLPQETHKLSNNLFSELTKLYVESSLSLSLFLVRHVNFEKFITGFSTVNISELNRIINNLELVSEKKALIIRHTATPIKVEALADNIAQELQEKSVIAEESTHISNNDTIVTEVVDGIDDKKE